jgi:lipoprotein-releasing system permease protein
LIIVISVMTGFDRQLRDKILGFNAHLRIVKPDASLTNWTALRQAVRSHPAVKSAAPFVIAQVLVKTQPETGNPKAAAPYVRGVEVESAGAQPAASVGSQSPTSSRPPLQAEDPNVSFLHTNMLSGEFELDGYSVLVGSTLAYELGVQVGDRILIYSPVTLQEMERKRGTKDEEAVLPEEYTVRGIFDVGYYEYNANVIVTSLRNAQDLYGLGGSVHGLMVTLDDPYRAELVRGELRKVLDHSLDIRTWSQENSTILNALEVEKNVMFYLLFFIMIVAAFGIMNSLITFVVQKTREIGVMKALGATRGQILWLFLSQSAIVGIIGVSAGFGLGMLAVHYRNEFLHFMRRVTKLELFPQQIYSFTELPAVLDPKDIALICGSALVICVLAGLIPAWNAARLNPVAALRHE